MAALRNSSFKQLGYNYVKALVHEKRVAACGQRPFVSSCSSGLLYRQEVHALDDFLTFRAEAELDELVSKWCERFALVN